MKRNLKKKATLVTRTPAKTFVPQKNLFQNRLSSNLALCDSLASKARPKVSLSSGSAIRREQKRAELITIKFNLIKSFPSEILFRLPATKFVESFNSSNTNSNIPDICRLGQCHKALFDVNLCLLISGPWLWFIPTYSRAWWWYLFTYLIYLSSAGSNPCTPIYLVGVD